MVKTEVSPKEEKWFVFAVLLAGVVASYNGVNMYIALPSLMDAFQVTMKELQWAIIMGMLSSCVTMPICGYFMDRFSSRRTFIAALWVLIGGSVFCAMAPNIPILTAGRFLQGMGMGMVMAVGLAVVYQFLPKQRQLMAVAIVSSTLGLGAAIGPSLAGALVHWLGWPSIFWINVPFAILSLILVMKLIPYQTFADNEPLDKIGLITSTIGTLGLLFAFNKGSEFGWLSPITLGLIAFSGIVLVIFIWHEFRTATPMLNFKVLRYPAYFLAFVFLIFISYATSSASTFMPLFLQNIIGLNELQAGLWLIIPASMMAILTPISAKMEKYINGRVLVLVGTLILLLGTWQMSRFTIATTAAGLIFWLAVRYSGMGIHNPIINDFAMASVPVALVSHASALVNWMRQLVATISLSLQTVIYTDYMDRLQKQNYGAELGLADQLRLIECEAIDLISFINVFVIIASLPFIYFFKESLQQSKENQQNQ